MADLKDFIRDFQNIEKDLTRTIQNKLLLKDIARTLLKDLKKRIESGYGVNNNKSTKFKVLKQSTIKHRKRQKEKGKLDSRTNPSKSNQIETGKFIDGLFYINNKQEIVISPSRDRIEMVKGQMKQGRNAVDITDDDLEYILEVMEKDIEKILDRRLKA